jgi:hypothetical protein
MTASEAAVEAMRYTQTQPSKSTALARSVTSDTDAVVAGRKTISTRRTRNALQAIVGERVATSAQIPTGFMEGSPALDIRDMASP